MRIGLSLTEERRLSGVDVASLRRIVRETLRTAFPETFRKNITVSLSVASVSNASIAKHNADYRKKHAPTDILSFGSFARPSEVARFSGKQLDLGEIILSPEFIRASAKEDGVSWKHEFTFVFVHGILHLLGFDHSKRMFSLQDTITEKLMK